MSTSAGQTDHCVVFPKDSWLQTKQRVNSAGTREKDQVRRFHPPQNLRESDNTAASHLHHRTSLFGTEVDPGRSEAGSSLSGHTAQHQNRWVTALCEHHKEPYPLQWYDVFIRQLVSSHWVNHVLPDQLLHTLLSDHQPPGHRTECQSRNREIRWCQTKRNSRGSQDGTGDAVAQDVSGYGADIPVLETEDGLHH